LLEPEYKVPDKGRCGTVGCTSAS